MTDEEIKLRIFISVLASQYAAAPNWAIHGTNPGSPDEFLDHAITMTVKGFKKFKEIKNAINTLDKVRRG